MMVFTSTQQEVDEQWGLYEGWVRLASCTQEQRRRHASPIPSTAPHTPSRRLVDRWLCHAQLSSRSQPVKSARLQDRKA